VEEARSDARLNNGDEGGNVAVVRKALEAWGRRDGATLREVLDEQAEFRSAIIGGIEGGVYRGHDDIERNFADLDDAFDDWHTEDERFLDVGGDKVVVLYRIVGRGKGSGVPIDRAVGIVFTLRDGKILLGEVHLENQEALKAGFAHSFSLFGADDIDAAVANLDPDVEWDHQPGMGAPEEGVYRGREQVRSLLERLREAWEDFGVDIRDVTAEGDRYVVNATIHARGKISDIPLDAECEYVLEFRDSKVMRVRFTTGGVSATSPQEKTDVA
jgi:ketosteroid isomerase-like protein